MVVEARLNLAVTHLCPAVFYLTKTAVLLLARLHSRGAYGARIHSVQYYDALVHGTGKIWHDLPMRLLLTGSTIPIRHLEIGAKAACATSS